MRFKLLAFLTVLSLVTAVGGHTLAQSTPAGSAPAPAAAPAPAPKFHDGITLSIGGRAPITFVPTKLQYLTQSYVKLTGVDLADDKLVDDFAIINYCNAVQQYYRDEFAWRRAREAIRTVIIRNMENYPEYFFIVGTLPIGRYDFEKKAFMLDPNYVMRRTGLFRAFDRNFSCGTFSVDRMPLEYTFRLTNPITLDRIEVPEDKAFEITRKLDTDANLARIVHVAFYLRVNDFSTIYAGQTNTVAAASANVRAQLLSMRVYLDKERKHMIFEHTE
jgi:hypothetical protein